MENKYRLKDSTVTQEGGPYHFPGSGVSLGRDGSAFVWLDKNSKLEVSYGIGRFIEAALKIGHKGLNKEGQSLISKIMKYSNCHKMFLAFFGVPLNLLGSSSQWVNDEMSIIFRDNMIKNVGDYLSLKEYLNNSSEFPLGVTFGLNNKDKKESNLLHSVIVLGKDDKGRFICLQKRGAGSDMPIELTDIDVTFGMYGVSKYSSPDDVVTRNFSVIDYCKFLKEKDSIIAGLSKKKLSFDAIIK